MTTELVSTEPATGKEIWRGQAGNVDETIERARKAGAEAGDAVYIADSSEAVSVRLGALEEVERSESEHIGLRVFVGGASASIGSTDLTDSALDELASRAVDMARAAPADKFAGLAPEELLLRTAPPELDLVDEYEPDPQTLRRWAEEAEPTRHAPVPALSPGPKRTSREATFMLGRLSLMEKLGNLSGVMSGSD